MQPHGASESQVFVERKRVLWYCKGEAEECFTVVSEEVWFMATSSIYENVRLKGNQQATAFLEAVEASEEDARKHPIQVENNLLRDTASINRIFARGKKDAVSQ